METLWLLWKAVYCSGHCKGIQYIHVFNPLLPLPQSQQTAGLQSASLPPWFKTALTRTRRGCWSSLSLRAVTLVCNLPCWREEKKSPTQTVNNEWLLAFETEQAKRNTKHSSERTVITHKPVSALLEGIAIVCEWPFMSLACCSTAPSQTVAVQCNLVACSKRK